MQTLEPIDASAQRPFPAMHCEAGLDGLRPLEDFVVEHARGFGLDPKQETRLVLVLDELLTNICQHAYPRPGLPPDGHARGRMGVRFERAEPGHLRFVVFDWGTAFDPTAQNSAPEGNPLDRPVGGLGLHLVKSIVAGLSYRRVPEPGLAASGGRNELTVLFPLAHADAPTEKPHPPAA